MILYSVRLALKHRVDGSLHAVYTTAVIDLDEMCRNSIICRCDIGFWKSSRMSFTLILFAIILAPFVRI